MARLVQLTISGEKSPPLIEVSLYSAGKCLSLAGIFTELAGKTADSAGKKAELARISSYIYNAWPFGRAVF
ncbi:hypothetical protein [Cytobacillus firmus]|uniref:hypothetical protein n=1 Tax=Cytobacillus firmus TaxID=1399 RepID=UPI001C8EC6CD|nr:hypothetical protein [Cytobacillus firmus]MBX9972678.1 hypothetical protein [Cytobacillus firmus]